MAKTSAPIFAPKPFAAIFVLLAVTLVAVGLARLAGYKPPATLPSQPPEIARLLHFEDAPQGAVLVRDARTHEQIKSFGRGEGSFVRATLRALVNDRKRKGISLKGDFRLERHSGGQLYLIDEATGRTISLNAFGPANTAAFAAFLSSQQKGEGL